MKIIFLFSLLFVTLISVTESTGKVDNYPTCLMPCRQSSNIPRQSLAKILSSSVDSYTITTILDGYYGYFKIIISHNVTEYHLYSAKIHVENWLFDSLCRILNKEPVITPVETDISQLKVHFPDFRLFYVYLQLPEDTLLEMFFEKVGILQKEATAAHEDCTSRLTNLENRVAKLELHPKLKYAISNAEITGNSWRCTMPYALSQPTGSGYCAIPYGNWVYIDLTDIFLINYIWFRLVGRDPRVYTYSLDVSTDRINWTNLAVNKLGQGIQEYELDEGMEIRFIRMRGRNTLNNYLGLQSFAVDFI